MNSSEGLMRIAKVVQWIGTGLAYLWAIAAMAALLFSEASDKWGIVLICVICVATCYGAGRGLSWILEGFAKPK